MQDLLAHPAFQAALAPLICSFVAALVLHRAGNLWQGMAVVVGIFVAILLITGLSFQPLTSTRKIILCTLVLPFLAVPLFRSNCPAISRALLLSIAMGCAALWVAWPVLGREEGMVLWLTGGRVALFAAVIGAGMSWLGGANAPRQGGVMLALGIGVGASAFIAASALYGQLAFAVSASVGGLLLVVLLEPSIKIFGVDKMRSGLGGLSLFAVAVPLGLIGGAATVYAQLPSMALIFLALIPFVAAIHVFRQLNPWISVTLTTLSGLIIAAPALWLAWSAAETVSY
jgi:uncharacterized protein YqgC (DUF456 family)